MEVDIITKNQLKGFVNSELFQQLTTLPISSLRAQYFLHANHIADSDPLIVLVRDGFETLSYAIFLPDTTRWGQRFAWNSGWWVHPHKGKPYALLPLIKGIDLWEEKVAFADLPKHSAKILKTLNRFRFLPTNDGVRLILRPYLPTAKATVTLLHFLDNWGKLCSPLGYWGLSTDIFELQSTAPSNIDWHSNALLNPNIGLTIRNNDDFSNIVKYPWLAQQPHTAQNEAARFPFSLVTKQFNIHFFNLAEKGKSVGTTVLKMRDGHLQIAYLTTAPNHIHKAINTVLRFAIRQGLKSITVYRSDLAKAMIEATPFLVIKRTVASQTAFGMGLELDQPNNLILHDGEGDCIFT